MNPEFNVALGLQIHKGHGPSFDYLHLHYRNAGVMLAMGMPMIEHIRQLTMRWTDTHSRGLSKFDRTLAAIKLVERREDAADWARRLRDAALKDSAGKELDGVIQTIKSFA